MRPMASLITLTVLTLGIGAHAAVAQSVTSPGFSLTNPPVGVAPAAGSGGLSADTSDAMTPMVKAPTLVTHHHRPIHLSAVPAAGASPPSNCLPHPAYPSHHFVHRAHLAALAPQPLLPESFAGGPWVTVPGETLATTLGRWAAAANWTVLYQTDYQYPIQSAATFNGNFETAGQALIQAVQANPLPVAQFNEDNKTVVVTSRDH